MIEVSCGEYGNHNAQLVKAIRNGKNDIRSSQNTITNGLNNLTAAANGNGNGVYKNGNAQIHNVNELRHDAEEKFSEKGHDNNGSLVPQYMVNELLKNGQGN